MPATKPKLKALDKFLGIDERTGALNPNRGSLTSMTNLFYNKESLPEIRRGRKAIANNGGKYGLFKYNRFNQVTGAPTTEILSVGETLYKLTAATITVAYAGASVCLVTIYSDPTNNRIKFKIVEGSTTKLDFSLGKGFDEASPVTLAGLKTQIDAISGGNFSATISGTTTTPAAFLPFKNNITLTSTVSFAAAAYYWTAVNCPVALPLSWFETNKNSDELQNCVPVQARNAMFLPNLGTYGLLKYDGQTLYRAGVPRPNNPSAAAVAAAAGTAEITSILCRGAAGVAEVSTVGTIADTSVAEVFTATFTGTWVHYQDKYFKIFDAAGSVAVWWNTGGSSEPAHGCNRAIEVDLSSHGSSGNVALQTKIAIDADSQFSCSVVGSTITVTNSVVGARIDPTVGTVDPSRLTLTVTTQGASGLNNLYFNLYDSTGKVTVWINVASGGTQPNTGAVRYIAVPISASATAAAVATAVQTAVHADAAFNATVLSTTVTVTHASAYAVTDIEAGTSGFTVAVTTQGLDSLQSKYFILYDNSNDSVAFWFNIAGGGVEPAHGASRSVEMTSIGASDADTAVATAVEVYIEADEWNSSVASATITATATAVGARSAPSAGTSGFTITVTTPGVNAGIGAATYQVKLTVIQRDANGVEVEGNPTEAVSVTLSTGAQDIGLTIQGVQPTSGFNTGCARISGNQTAQTTLNVDSGHTLLAGDQAYLLNRAGTPTYVTRTVVSVTSTTIVLDTAVTVSDNDIVSNGLKIGYYRTEGAGLDFRLVAELPNNSLDGTFEYTDTMLDSVLAEQPAFEDPVVDRSPPGAFKYLTIRDNALVGSGFADDVNRVSFSDVEIEHWPIASGFGFLADTPNGDRVAALFNNNTALVVGKIGEENRGGSQINVSGILDEFGNFVLDIKSLALGACSQSSIVEIEPGLTAFATTKGAYAQAEGSAPIDTGWRIEPSFTQKLATGYQIALNRVTAVSDPDNELVLFFVPREPTSGTKYATSDSEVIVFDYSKLPDGSPSNRWFKWNNINAAGGFVRVGSDIYFLERRRSDFTGQVEGLLYKFNNEQNDGDYYDHHQFIETRIEDRWEDFDEPNKNKFVSRLKVNSTPGTGNAFSCTAAISYNYRGTPRTQKTITFGGEGDDYALVNLVEGKGKAFKLALSTSQVATRFYYSGWEWEYSDSYNDGLVP